MAMTVSGDGSDDAVLSDINTTPLVDVMLVLLIIFLITVPVAIKTVKVKVPNVAYQSTATKAENVVLSVRREPDNSCGVYWGLSRVHAVDLQNRAVAKFSNEVERLGDKAKSVDDLPEVHIRADRNAPYRCVGGVISIMQGSGFLRVGFISEPKLASI
ncbi:MAG TPA: biopolymer transporter ExbD [Chakrabartia sp.]|jgi:biopolymer transport protein ExbD|nr:biopolymer transporter ExbD [Chakrabartia sp.]